tara:strand:- start:70 stop:417 length:348 start_codon:yes stop_codon:yes gene_type:complete
MVKTRSVSVYSRKDRISRRNARIEIDLKYVDQQFKHELNLIKKRNAYYKKQLRIKLQEAKDERISLGFDTKINNIISGLNHKSLKVGKDKKLSLAEKFKLKTKQMLNNNAAKYNK